MRNAGAPIQSSTSGRLGGRATRRLLHNWRVSRRMKVTASPSLDGGFDLAPIDRAHLEASQLWRDLDQGPGYVTGHGLASQISLAYCAIVRSLENPPEAAMFKIALRCQASGSA